MTDHNTPEKNAERGGTAETAHTTEPRPPVTDHNTPEKNAERGGTAETAHTTEPTGEAAPNTELQDELESIRAIGENR